MIKRIRIDTIALEEKAGLQRSKNLRWIGTLTIFAGLAITVLGEISSNKKSLKIHAVNNEAADLIEELDNIWVAQKCKK